MEPVIRELEDRVVLAVAHVGPFMELQGAFQKIAGYCGSRGLIGPETRVMGLFHDDPEETPQERLRSHACIDCGDAGETHEIEDGSGVERITIKGGRHAVFVHKGPYATLHETYKRICEEWAPSSGETLGYPTHEVYISDPTTTPEDEVLTEIRFHLR